MFDEDRRKVAAIDPDGSLGHGMLLTHVDEVRLFLYSGLLFTSLTLITVYVARRFKWD